MTEGDTTLAAQYTANATRTADAINANLNLFGATTGAHIVDGNVMALLGGVATGARADAVRAMLRTQWTQENSLLDRDPQPAGRVGHSRRRRWELLLPVHPRRRQRSGQRGRSHQHAAGAVVRQRRLSPDRPGRARHRPRARHVALVSTTVSGSTITISLDGTRLSTIDTSSLPSGTPTFASGTVGFREYPGERARLRNLTVTDASGAALYDNSLSNPSALGDFAGPSVTVSDPLPVILDEARRDRVVWSGDLGAEGTNVFHTTAANDYVRGSLALLASCQNANGESGTNVPPTVPLGTFPASGDTYAASYSMDEVDNIATYYRYTDRAFVRSEWPMIQRELAYNRGMGDSRGPLITDGSDGLDWDHYDGPKTGAVTAYNVIYDQAVARRHQPLPVRHVGGARRRL